MEITKEERVDLAVSTLTIVESAIIQLKELQGDDLESVEFETILTELEKYSKRQIKLIKGY